MQCLNIKNKEVAALLKEYTEIFGNEDAAYYILSENNGYGLDKAPNGADSKLFSDLLAHYNGDKNKAILAKSKVYTDSFKNWFGDWLSDNKSNVSKVVDENDEPLIVYHGSNHNITKFDKQKLGSNTGKGEYKDKTTGEVIEVDSNNAFFASSNKLVAASYSFLGTQQRISELKNKIEDLYTVLTVGQAYNGTVKNRNDVNKTFKELAEQFSELKSLVEQVPETGKIPEEVKNKLIENLNTLNKRYSEINNNYSGRSFTNQYNYYTKAINKLNSWLTDENLNKLKSNDKSLFEEDQASISLSVGKDSQSIYLDDDERYKYVGLDGRRGYLDTLSIPQLRKLLIRIINSLKQGLKQVNEDLKKSTYANTTYVGYYYVNMKNPLVHDYNSSSFPDKYVNQKGEKTEYPTGYIAGRQVKKAMKDGNDGVIYHNLQDPLLSDSYGFFDPNQIKSIDNQGTFSTQDNNIYLSDSSDNTTEPITINEEYENSSVALSSMLSSNDNQTKEMATVLNEVSKKIGAEPVSIQYVDIPLNELYPEATYWTPAVYDKNTNTIVVNRNADFGRYGSLENVLLHEIAHALTIDSLSSDSKSAKELQEIFNEYKKHHKDHASTNVYEFAAELFSNPEVIRNMYTFRDTKTKKTLLQKLIDWFKRLFGKNTTHKDLVNKIVDNIIEFNAYKTLENLEDSDNFIPTVLPAASAREEIAYDKIKNIFSDITKTAFNRLGALKYNEINKSFDKNETIRTEKLLSKLNDINRSVTDEANLDNLLNFLNGTIEYVDSVLFSLNEAEDVIKQLDSKLTTAHANDNSTQVSKYRTILDNFGAEYLDPHLSNLKNLYNELQKEFNTNVYKNLLGEEYFNQVVTIISGLINELSSTKMVTKDNVGYLYNNIVRRTSEQFLREEMASAKDPSINNALKNWLTFDSDINIFNKKISIPTNASSFVFRLIRKVIGDVNTITHRQFYRKYAEIYNKVKDISNPLSIMEKDSSGKYTGYIIRDRKYGVYQNNKYKWRKKWLKDHKVASIDELRLNPNLWLQYQKDYNKWKSENAERRFTPEFYEIFVNLSPEANMALSEINTEIDNLVKPFLDPVTKKPRFEEMTEDEYDYYNRLLRRKRNLANPYDPITGDLKPEGSVEYNVAMELSEAYEKINKGVKSKVNMDAFLEEMNKMKNVQGYTPDGKYTLYEAWLERNTRWEFSEEFKKLISNRNKTDYGELYDSMYNARNNLLNLYKNDKNEPDYTIMPDLVKEKIRQIDRAMENIRNSAKDDREDKPRFFKTKFTSVVEENGGKNAVTEDDYWVDSKGRIHYYSYMIKIVPIFTKYLVRMPNNNWAETSEESTYYNKNYDRNIPEAEQPKLSIKDYDNRKEYAKVMSDEKLKDFRQLYIDTMDEANSKLTHTNYKNNYKLPQRNGTIYNYIGARGLITGVREYMLDAFSITPDDELHGVKVENRPNGTEINILPTMYTTMLNDPAVISHDIIGSLMLYYRMACNYENKKAVAPQLNLIDRLIKREGEIRTGDSSISAESSNLSSALHDYLGYHLYGRSQTLSKVGSDSKKVSMDKVFKLFARWGRDIGLAWNIRSAISGNFSAIGFYRADASLKRNFNMKDFRHAELELAKEMFTLKLLSQLGRNISNSKLVGSLEANGLTFRLENEFENTARWRLGKVVTNLFNPYSAFKLASLIPNSLLTVSVYNNYKLLKLEDGNLHFISENDFLNNHFQNMSMEEKQAIYDNTKENLWNAYYMDDVNFKVKPKYKEYISEELENEIASKLNHLASHAEGQVEEADKSGIYFNTALSTILMFRAFIPKNIENTVSSPHWNYQTKEMMMGTLTSFYVGWKIGMNNNLIKILNLFSSKKDKNENLKKYQKAFPNVNIESEVKKYINRFYAQMFSYLFFLVLSNIIAGVEDDDDQWVSFIKLELNKISLEFGSRYNVMDLLSILNSLSPLTKTVGSLWDAFMPFSYFNESKYKKIKKGAYKGYYGWQRDIFKVIPITNAYFNLKNPEEKLKDFNNRLK